MERGLRKKKRLIVYNVHDIKFDVLLKNRKPEKLFSNRGKTDRVSHVVSCRGVLELLLGHVHVVVLARPIPVIGSVYHVRRDGGQQRRAVRTHAEVPQQHFRHGVRPRRLSVLVDHQW